MQTLINSVSSYYDSIAALVGAIILATELLNQKTKLNGVWAWLQSWGISLVICLFGSYFTLGVFAEATKLAWYWEGILSSVILGLVANGVFSIPGVTQALEFIKVRDKAPAVPPEQTTSPVAKP